MYEVGDTVLVLGTRFECKVEVVHPNFGGLGSVVYTVRMPREAMIEEDYRELETFDEDLLGLPAEEKK